MRGQRENFRKAVQSFEIKKRKIDIYGNYEANGVEKNQRKFEIFSTLISKKSTKDELQYRANFISYMCYTKVSRCPPALPHLWKNLPNANS